MADEGGSHVAGGDGPLVGEPDEGNQMKRTGLTHAEAIALAAAVAALKREAEALAPQSAVRGVLLSIGSNLSRALGEDRLRRPVRPRARRAPTSCPR